MNDRLMLSNNVFSDPKYSDETMLTAMKYVLPENIFTNKELLEEYAVPNVGELKNFFNTLDETYKPEVLNKYDAIIKNKQSGHEVVPQAAQDIPLGGKSRRRRVRRRKTNKKKTRKAKKKTHKKKRKGNKKRKTRSRTRRKH